MDEDCEKNKKAVEFLGRWYLSLMIASFILGMAAGNLIAILSPYR